MAGFHLGVPHNLGTDTTIINGLTGSTVAIWAKDFACNWCSQKGKLGKQIRLADALSLLSQLPDSDIRSDVLPWGEGPFDDTPCDLDAPKHLLSFRNNQCVFRAGYSLREKRGCRPGTGMN